MRAAAVLILLLFLQAAGAVAETQTLSQGGWEYTWDREQNTVEIVGYTGDLQEVTVPKELDGAKVVSIGEGAFRDQKKLTKVTLQEGITALGVSAFSGCLSLETVVLPDTLESIGSKAFANTAVETLEIPGSVVSLGDGAFSGCSALAHLLLHEGTVRYGMNLFGSTTLYDTQGQKTIRTCGKLKTLVLPEGDLQMDSTALSGITEVQVLSFGEGITALPDLQYCTALQCLSLPESLTDTESLAKAKIPAGAEIYGKAGSAALAWAAENGYTVHEQEGTFLRLTAKKSAVFESGESFSLQDLAVLTTGTACAFSAEADPAVLVVSGEMVTCTGAGSAELTIRCPDYPEAGTASCRVQVYAPVTDFSFTAGNVIGRDTLAVNLRYITGSVLHVAPLAASGTNPEYTFYWRMDSWNSGKLCTSVCEGIDIDLLSDGMRIRHDSGIVMAVSRSGVVRSVRLVLYTAIDSMKADPAEMTLEEKHSVQPWVRFVMDDGAWGPDTDSWYGVLPVPDGTTEYHSDWNPDWEPEDLQKVPVRLTGLYTMSSGDSTVVAVKNGMLVARKPGTATIKIRSVQDGKTASLKVTVPQRQECILPDRLKTLSAGALRGTAGAVIVVPDTVESIGEGAFAGCGNLVTVEIPAKFSDTAQWQTWFDEDTDAESIVVIRN